jgi:hypothetical protein
MRPASGQGASAAFEDAVLLCRYIKRYITDNSNLNIYNMNNEINPLVEERKALLFNNYDDLNVLLRNFEIERMRRVRIIHDDQRNLVIKFSPWTNDFTQWVYEGV